VAGIDSKCWKHTISLEDSGSQKRPCVDENENPFMNGSMLNYVAME